VTPFFLLEYKGYKMTLLSKFHAYLTMLFFVSYS